MQLGLSPKRRKKSLRIELGIYRHRHHSLWEKDISFKLHTKLPDKCVSIFLGTCSRTCSLIQKSVRNQILVLNLGLYLLKGHHTLLTVMVCQLWMSQRVLWHVWHDRTSAYVFHTWHITNDVRCQTELEYFYTDIVQLLLKVDPSNERSVVNNQVQKWDPMQGKVNIWENCMRLFLSVCWYL